MIVFLSFETENEKFKFNYIYENYKRLLLHKAYLVLNDYSLSEDAVSEAFIRIYKNIHKINDVTSGKTISFLVTIVRNVAITILNREKQQPCMEYDELNMQDDFNLEAFCVSNAISHNILSIVDSLKEDLKAPFLLKYAHDYSHKEISKILKISENNVTVRIHRAKKKLIELMKKEGNMYEL